MNASLLDPWFEAEFYGQVTDSTYRRQGGEIEGAQGLLLWCPCGYGKPEYPLEGGRPHAVIVPFLNPRNAPEVTAGHGPQNKSGGARPRWTMSGTRLGDLTLSPSIDVSCWHGYIRVGRVT